jgi:CBS-domain-containing membrane protein
MLVKHLMSSPVVSLLADQTVPLAHEIMLFRHIRHLPVVDARGGLVGLVTHRDLVRWGEMTAELRREGREKLRVEQIMTRDVWTVNMFTHAASAARIMLERKYGCAPVVAENHHLVGILTESDFLRVAIDALETPRQRLRIA